MYELSANHEVHDASQALDFPLLEQRVFEFFAAHNSMAALNKTLHSLFWAFTEVKGEVTPVKTN